MKTRVHYTAKKCVARKMAEWQPNIIMMVIIYRFGNGLFPTRCIIVRYRRFARTAYCLHERTNGRNIKQVARERVYLIERNTGVNRV